MPDNSLPPIDYRRPVAGETFPWKVAVVALAAIAVLAGLKGCGCGRGDGT